MSQKRLRDDGVMKEEEEDPSGVASSAVEDAYWLMGDDEGYGDGWGEQGTKDEEVEVQLEEEMDVPPEMPEPNEGRGQHVHAYKGSHAGFQKGYKGYKGYTGNKKSGGSWQWNKSYYKQPKYEHKYEAKYDDSKWNNGPNYDSKYQPKYEHYQAKKEPSAGSSTGHYVDGGWVSPKGEFFERLGLHSKL